MARSKKNLSEIMFEITSIQEKLYNGQLDFTYDKIYSALGAGHPAEILDNVISDVFWKVRSNSRPLKSEVEKMLSDLENFKDEFEIEKLDKPIEQLKTLLIDYRDYPPFDYNRIKEYWSYTLYTGDEYGYIVDGKESSKRNNVAQDILVYITSQIVDEALKGDTDIVTKLQCVIKSIYAGFVASSFSQKSDDNDVVADYVMDKCQKKALSEYTNEAMGFSNEESEKFFNSAYEVINDCLYADGIKTNEMVLENAETIINNLNLYAQTGYLYGMIIEGVNC